MVPRGDAIEFIERHLDEVGRIAALIDRRAVARLLDLLADVRDRGGRLFVLGVGGSAANASHAVSDLRKLCGFEAYAPTDNVAELTARINDEGWERSLADWLRASRLAPDDAVLVLSVGGGDAARNVSVNLVHAIEYARSVGSRTGAIVGRDGGHAGRVADAAVIIPAVNDASITPHTEAFQAVIWHLLVSHPRLRVASGKWESLLHDTARS